MKATVKDAAFYAGMHDESTSPRGGQDGKPSWPRYRHTKKSHNRNTYLQGKVDEAREPADLLGPDYTGQRVEGYADEQLPIVRHVIHNLQVRLKSMPGVLPEFRGRWMSTQMMMELSVDANGAIDFAAFHDLAKRILGWTRVSDRDLSITWAAAHLSVNSPDPTKPLTCVMRALLLLVRPRAAAVASACYCCCCCCSCYCYCSCCYHSPARGRYYYYYS
jgi:hypothetical protein